MILDTSAIIAMMLREPELGDFSLKIASAAHVGVGAPTLVEASIVLAARSGAENTSSLTDFLTYMDVLVIPFEHDQWIAAADAWRSFGRGRHPARLNLGDCLTYATAKVANEPLLCKGDDFAKTDLELA